MEKKDPAVTIGLPVSGERLRDFQLAVRSIFRQNWSDWELIIVLDDAYAELEEASRSIDDARVRVVRHHTREGLARRLNEIALLADGATLIRMDSDDVMMHNRVAASHLFFRANPEKCVLGGRAYVIDERDVVRGLFAEPPLPGEPAGLLRSNALTHPTVASRTDWALRHRYDETLQRSQDKALWLDSADTLKTFEKLDVPLIYYRIPSQLSTSRQGLSSHCDRRLVRERGHTVARRYAVRSYLLKSYLKQATFASANAVGLGGWLYNRKVIPIPADTRRSAEQEIGAVAAWSVPGWR